MFEMIKQLQFNYKYYQFIAVLVLLQHESLLKCKKTGFFHLLFQPLPIFTYQKWPNPVQKKKQLENLFCNIIIMSKYKYEKEFMFSNKRLDEVQLFLENQENLLDLLAIRDINKNTVIHHTAYHNQTKVLELYLKYYRKNLQNQHRNLVQIKFQTRYLLDEPNSEGYTAVHYAVFRGNISVLKVLQKYEANFNLTNHLKMGVLHLAAQGDKLCSFLYMHNRKLDINIRDSKMSTPLHWAAFSGGQKVVQYLLAQKQIDIDPVDVEGFTPLHLATTYGNSKIAKKLLIAGADRQLMTTKGQTALQIAQQKQFNGIKRMLDENYTIKDRLKLLCNAKIKYRPETKSLLCALVFLLVTAIASLMSFWILEFIDLWAQIVQICVYLLALFLYLSLTFTGKKGENKPQNYALYAQNRRLYHLCLICVKQMNFRQRHCHICKACIPQYDHHCTWINNCVGKHNLFRFNLFLYVTLISLIWCGFLSVRVFVCLLRSQYDTLLFMVRPWFQQDGRLILLAVAVVIFLVFLVFGLPLIFLILVQAKNLLLGKTTYERFSKSQESLLTRQGSFLNLEKSRIQPSSASLRNCLNMCCEYENLSKQDREFSNSTSSSANRIVQ